jgi:gluconolactonase
MPGFLAGNRPTPLLPNQVYSYNPLTKDLRVVADGFGRPNGLAASADQRTIYIGDTGAMIGNGTEDYQGPRTIYSYDRDGHFLSNRRVFAIPSALRSGADGIKTDRQGNGM